MAKENTLVIRFGGEVADGPGLIRELELVLTQGFFVKDPEMQSLVLRSNDLDEDPDKLYAPTVAEPTSEVSDDA